MIDQLQGYLPSNTMREVLRDNSLLVMTVSRFGIPFGFGDETVEEVCRKNRVDTSTFLTVCNLMSRYPYNASRVSLITLIDYLKRAHNSFLNVVLPRIRHHLIEAINHSDNNEVSILIMKFYDDYVREVRKHMSHENKHVFHYVENLIEGNADGNFVISHYSENHDHTAAKLNELKDIIIYHYEQNDNGRLSATLFDIVMCEKDMISHFDVESKLFIPAVMRLEEELTEAAEDSASSAQSEENTDQSSLSSREIDIIRCVACGKSNKEIAKTLFISPHTVATHRRNINAKLGIHSAAGLTIYAIIHNIIDAKDVQI